MEKGTKVKIRGTRLEGEVISTDQRFYTPISRTGKIMFIKVRHTDGKEMEYLEDEIRKI